MLAFLTHRRARLRRTIVALAILIWVFGRASAELCAQSVAAPDYGQSVWRELEVSAPFLQLPLLQRTEVANPVSSKNSNPITQPRGNSN